MPSCLVKSSLGVVEPILNIIISLSGFQCTSSRTTDTLD